MWCSRSSASLRTQTRPAIEYVSGEEGLRPKSYFFVFSFVEYVFTVIQKYEEAPGTHCGAEGTWRWRRFAALSLADEQYIRCFFLLVAFQSPLCVTLSHKMSLIIDPLVSAQVAGWRPERPTRACPTVAPLPLA